GRNVTGVQTCALPIFGEPAGPALPAEEEVRRHGGGYARLPGPVPEGAGPDHLRLRHGGAAGEVPGQGTGAGDEGRGPPLRRPEEIGRAACRARAGAAE